MMKTQYDHKINKLRERSNLLNMGVNSSIKFLWRIKVSIEIGCKGG